MCTHTRNICIYRVFNYTLYFIIIVMFSSPALKFSCHRCTLYLHVWCTTLLSPRDVLDVIYFFFFSVWNYIVTSATVHKKYYNLMILRKNFLIIFIYLNELNCIIGIMMELQCTHNVFWKIITFQCSNSIENNKHNIILYWQL